MHSYRMGRLEEIWVKRAHGGRMDAARHATLDAGQGIAGNANRGGRRQVTIVARERWNELMTELGASLETSARRANIVVSGIDLLESRGRVLLIGGCRLRVLGETRPCEQMEDAFPGLQEAMKERWGGGAFAEILEGGQIAIGDSAAWES